MHIYICHPTSQCRIYISIYQYRLNMAQPSNFHSHCGASVCLTDDNQTAEWTGNGRGHGAVFSREALQPSQWFIVRVEAILGNTVTIKQPFSLGVMAMDPDSQPQLPLWVWQLDQTRILRGRSMYQDGQKLGEWDGQLEVSKGDEVGIMCDGENVWIYHRGERREVFSDVPGPVWAVMELDHSKLSVQPDSVPPSPVIETLNRTTYTTGDKPDIEIAGPSPPTRPHHKLKAPIPSEGLPQVNRPRSKTLDNEEGFSQTLKDMDISGEYSALCSSMEELTVSTTKGPKSGHSKGKWKIRNLIRKRKKTPVPNSAGFMDVTGQLISSISPSDYVIPRRKTSIVKMGCPYWGMCDRYIESLQLAGAYLEAKYDRCYCDNCIKLRGDELYYIRGEPPKLYGLPKGWCRFGLRVSAAEALNIWKKWHVAFHGTSENNVQTILESQQLFIPGDKNSNGKSLAQPSGHYTEEWKPKVITQQIFLSPSIAYAGQPMYAHIHSWTDSVTGKQHNVQVAFQVRIKPDSYIVGEETLGLGSKKLDDKFSNKELEWSTKARGATHLTGILVKIS